MRAYHLKEFSRPDGLRSSICPRRRRALRIAGAHPCGVAELRDPRHDARDVGAGVKAPLVPCSDAAVAIAAVVAGVSKFKVGDRVTRPFPDWLYGDVRNRDPRSALGGGGKGVLAEQIVLHGAACCRSPSISR